MTKELRMERIGNPWQRRSGVQAQPLLVNGLVSSTLTMRLLVAMP